MTNHARSFNQETNQEMNKNITDGMRHTLVCNCCGHKIPAYPSPDARECVEITKKWGYFSDNKDGETHRFHICESCYDAWIATFAVAPEVTEDTELV